MTFLLDATVLIDVLRRRRNRRTLLAGLVEQGHILATSALNIGEVYSGMRPEEELETAAFLDSLECLPVTGKIARQAGSLKRAYQRKGKTLTLADMIVAATAMEHSATLMTDNRKDFAIEEIAFHPLP